MRHGFILGIAMFYMILLSIQMILTAEFTMTDANNLGKILDGYNMETRENEGVFGKIESFVNTNTGQSESSIGADDFIRVARTIAQMAFLYTPALFGNGNWLWLYWDFFFPVAVTFWLCMGLALFRGVSSG